MKYSNDIAMLVDGKLVVMIEHQSTINYNMPLRFLEYIARVYESMVNTRRKYGKRQLPLPRPEFYVFYNGQEDYPAEQDLRLSDAFILPGEKYRAVGELPLEILVKVVNINISKDNPVLQKCQPLLQYSQLIELAEEKRKQGEKDPIGAVLNEAIRRGILGDYLKRKVKEVRNMLISEYDYDTDIAVQRQEAWEDGMEKGYNTGIAEGESRLLQAKLETARSFLLMGFTMEQVAQGTGLPLETVQQLAAEALT